MRGINDLKQFSVKNKKYSTFSHGSNNLKRWRTNIKCYKNNHNNWNKGNAEHREKERERARQLSILWNYCKNFAPKPSNTIFIWFFEYEIQWDLNVLFRFELQKNAHVLFTRSRLYQNIFPVSFLLFALYYFRYIWFHKERSFCYLNSCTFATDFYKERKRFHAQFTLHHAAVFFCLFVLNFGIFEISSRILSCMKCGTI